MHLTSGDGKIGAAYANLRAFIASLFDGPVDVANRGALKPDATPAAVADGVHAS
jgi:hypothetical protein